MSSSSSSSYIPSEPVPVFTPGKAAGCCSGRENQAGRRGLLRRKGGVRTSSGKTAISLPSLLAAKGFNTPFSTALEYDSGASGESRGFGGNWVPACLPRLREVSGGAMIYERGPNEKMVFVPGIGGAYTPTYFVRDRLVRTQVSPGVHEYTLTTPKGCRQMFHGDGRLKSFSNAGGTSAQVTYGSGDLPESVEAAQTGKTWRVEYVEDPLNPGQIKETYLEINGHPVRKTVQTYDSDNRLLTVKVYQNDAAAGQPASWGTQTVEATRLTYHTDTGLLRHVITPVNWRQMVNNGINPETASETNLNAYADTEFAYDDVERVSVLWTNGRRYSYALEYIYGTPSSDSLNEWTEKTRITFPDNSVVTLYFNRAEELILKQVDTAPGVSPARTWYPVFQQFEEESGRVVLSASHSAIASVDPDASSPVTLKTDAGRVEVFAYDTAGRLYYTGLKEGSEESPPGALNKIRQYTYVTPPSDPSGPAHETASETVYRGPGGASPAVTAYSYLWHSGTSQISRRTTTPPVIPGSENGRNIAFTTQEHYDSDGYLTRFVDGGGSATVYEYNKELGGITKMTVDEGAGKLNLVTDYDLDYLGRTVRERGPAHDISLNGGAAVSIRRARWTYHKDREGEEWSFGGYQRVSDQSQQIVGPVTIQRPNLPPPAAGTGERQESVIDAVYSGTGIPAPSFSFGQSSWARWTLSLYDKAGKRTEERTYFVIPSSGYGTETANYGGRLFGYDSAGRLNQTTCAGGTIDKTTFNAMGWPVQEELGTSAGLTTVRLNEYDNNVAGDRNLTKVTLPVDGTPANNRVTEFAYDWRNRVKEEKTTVQKDGAGDWTLITVNAYDNRDLVISVTGYHTSAVTANRTSHRTIAHDALGRQYLVREYAVSASGATSTPQDGNVYYDANGRTVREAPAGSGLFTATKYDAAGRAVKVYRAWSGGMPFSASSGPGPDPADVSSSTVMEQQEYAWDNGGNLVSTAVRRRFDDATGTGELKYGAAASAQPKARVTYTAFYPDALGREQARADYGTAAAGSPPTPPATWSRPPAVPGRSDTVLVTTTAYSAAGNVGSVVDPAGRQICRTYDDADRLTVLTENCQSGSSSSSAGSGFATDVRTARCEYTNDGWLKKLRSDSAATGQQVTEWIYGVTPAQGSSLYSNRLIYQKKYPDSAGGTDLVTFKYNRQQQVTAMTDQAATVHAYAYDRLGRFLSDTVAFPVGTALDTTVNKLDNAYNERGLLLRAASYNTSGGAKRNEVLWQYNSFNRPEYEYQEHNNPLGVNTSTSLKVRYSYESGSANTTRPTAVYFPYAGTVFSPPVTTHYLSSAANALSRPDAVRESGVTLASFKYLGLNALVNLRYDAASNTELTMRNGTGTPGDAGDVYTGLDRFGRLIETIWQTGSVKSVHTSCVRNRAGGVLWKKDVLAATAQDHGYAYDGLQQVIRHRRGTLTGTAPNYGIGSLQQDEGFSFDETGNWLLNTATSPAALNQSRTHNRANEITTIQGIPNPAYDPAGNMTSMPSPLAWGTGFTTVWDAWNRLVEVNQGAADVSTNVYDALGRRVRKTTPSETRDYYYDKNWRSIEERSGGSSSSGILAQYTWSPGDRWTMIRRKRSSGGTLNQVHFVLKDYLDPAAIISTAGAVEERFGFDAFGPARFMDPVTFVTKPGNVSGYAWDFLFHAEFIDTESGLYNYGYRFYHPNLGRWISKDPMGESSGSNLYRFVDNNSCLFLDLLGLQIYNGSDFRDWDPTMPGPHNGYEPGGGYPPGKGPDDYKPYNIPRPPLTRWTPCCKEGKTVGYYDPDIQCCDKGVIKNLIPTWVEENYKSLEACASGESSYPLAISTAVAGTLGAILNIIPNPGTQLTGRVLVAAATAGTGSSLVDLLDKTVKCQKLVCPKKQPS